MAFVKSAPHDEILEFLTSTPTPEQIIAFRPSQDTQQRVSDLLDRSHNGALTAEEQIELDEFEQVEHLMRMLKARAKSRLSAH
jgi:hypothetical protein